MCQTVTKVPEEKIQQLREGNYIEDDMVKVSIKTILTTFFPKRELPTMKFLFQCFVHCSLEMLHLIEGTVGQFHVAGKHTDYMIPNELYDTTIKAFGHCETISTNISTAIRNFQHRIKNLDLDTFQQME